VIPTHAIREWFNQHKRELPWRKISDPYAIWVSEVMLQQTQVKVVISYFQKWLALFPTISSLALAQEEDVLKAWEGLGYYSRARNLHKGAKYVEENFGGSIPSSLELLRKIPGIGPYTAGAILSFAFKQKAVAIDANVARVLCRYFAIKDPKNLDKILLKELDIPRPYEVMEGLIEMGALVCQKAPKCLQCPISSRCLAYLNQETDQYPSKKILKKVEELSRDVFVILCGDKVLLFQEKKKLMEGLWHFPYVEKGDAFALLEKTYVTALSPIKHQFTRYRSILYPTVWRVDKEVELAGYMWISKEALVSLPFPSGHRDLKDWLVENLEIFYSEAQIFGV
jgi:A/G-specific adenine glycosylase